MNVSELLRRVVYGTAVNFWDGQQSVGKYRVEPSGSWETPYGNAEVQSVAVEADWYGRPRLRISVKPSRNTGWTTTESGKA